MSLFDKVLAEQINNHKLIGEDLGGDGGGAMGDGQMDAAAPAPEAPMDGSPTPEDGAETAKPVYDKPYQDLASVLYDALRVSFEDIEQSSQRKILGLHPESIKSDEQGVALFKTVEKVLNEMNGPDSDNIESQFGPGSTV